MTETDTAQPPPEESQPVEIHKPKPVHSWRELLTEIGVVVIGVCIALAAEQTVEWLHWRAQVQEARDVITAELASNMEGAAARISTALCTETRLDELAQIVDTAAKGGSLPPVGDIDMPPRSIWPTGAWDSVVASQAASHFPRQQLAAMAATYKLVQRLETIGTREIEAWENLYTMVGPGRRLDPASEEAIRKALSSARYSNHVMTSLSLQMADRITDLHLPFSRQELADIREQRHQSINGRFICGKIGPAPSGYGKAEGTITPQLLRRFNAGQQ
jgi:hypothetical protein